MEIGRRREGALKFLPDLDQHKRCLFWLIECFHFEIGLCLFQPWIAMRNGGFWSLFSFVLAYMAHWKKHLKYLSFTLWLEAFFLAIPLVVHVNCVLVCGSILFFCMGRVRGQIYGVWKAHFNFLKKWCTWEKKSTHFMAYRRWNWSLTWVHRDSRPCVFSWPIGLLIYLLIAPWFT